jgi:hypothetical protein
LGFLNLTKLRILKIPAIAEIKYNPVLSSVKGSNAGSPWPWLPSRLMFSYNLQGKIG